LLSLLEDSGYLARVAFVMDKIMHKLVGLHGKAFLPMLLGFGCCVPGVMATRTLEDEKDRIVTMLIVPFMSCNARLPVYILFIAAFFSAYQGLILFSLYFLGIAVAILTAFILKRTAFKGMSVPFIMELPPYRMPKLKGVCIHTWERGKGFLKKAGTIILATSIIIWTLSSLPVGVEYGTEDSVTGQIGTFLSPIFEPLGFGNWQTSVSLIFGVVAKENVVNTFGTLFGIDAEEDEDGMVSTLKDSFTPLSAYALLVFVLLYVPCFATVATIKKEANSWKWAGFNVVYSIAIAYVFAFIVYQGGTLLGLG
jgi:ferrous iron transport protein B